MKILANIGHPAHVHLFKNVIHKLEQNGHETFIVARDKDITLDLLNAYGFQYEVIDVYRESKFAKIYSFLKMELKLFNIVRKYKPDILIAVGDPFIAHAGFLFKKVSINFTDTENARLANNITVPFVSVMCTPSCFQKDFGFKHVRYNSYHELAYLHPNNFKPDSTVLSDFGLTKNDIFIVIRLVSWGASHDVGDSGISDIGEIISSLEKHGKVLITSEYELPDDFKKYQIKIFPEQMHHLLYYATLYIGESATMASESAILGTPSIFVSTSRRGYTDDLESNYDLAYTFSNPVTGQKEALEKASELLQIPNLKELWVEKKANMLNDKIDTTSFIVDLIEKYQKVENGGL